MSTNNRKNSHSGANHKLHLAVLAALPLMALASLDVSAACTGTIASPSTANSISVLCNGADTTSAGVVTHVGNLTNASTTNYVDTTTQTANGSTTVIQFDGEGRTLTNSGVISNNRTVNFATGTGRGRTAVLMGAATLNAGSGTLFATTGTVTVPVTGVTTVTLNAAPTAAYVGQTVVFGRYNADQGDFPAGESRVITSVDIANKTVTFATALSAAYAGTGTDPIGYKVVSNFGGGNNVVNNSGTISAQILAAEINANKNAAAVTATSIANSVANITTAIDGSSVAYTAAAKAVTMSVEGIYEINNAKTGIISVKNEGIGAAYAVEQGGAATELTLVNNGTISAERTVHVTLVDNLAVNSAVVAAPNATATSFSATTATSSDFTFASKQNLASVNAINTQEEGDLIDIANGATGVIRATGDYAGAIYMRNIAQIINNEGLIEWVAATGHTGARGYAIGSVSDGGEIRTLEINNAETGTIKGDILAVNGMAERWHNLSVEGVLNDRLLINTQFGQQDSTITNAGTIIGNVYLSNGTHVLTNEAGATLTGNIDVDQRDTTCGQASAYQAGCAIAGIAENARQTAIVEVVSTSGSKSQTVNVYTVSPEAGTVTSDITGLTATSTATNANALSSNASATTSVKTGVITTVGTKNFTFENAGDFTGNITIRTASSNVLGGATPVASHVTLIPTVSGSGAGSTVDAPSHNIEGMGDVLTIDATAGAGSVTVTPKSLVTVHKGEYFLVADSMVGTTPSIDNENTPLVNWNIATNAAGNLVVGVDSINSASSIAGVSARSGRAIDALMAGNSTLGGAVQGLTVAADIEKAGQQLRPEANNASMQATMAAVDQVSSVIGTHQDATRTASNGNSGVSTGEAAQGVGFWMQGFGFKGDQSKRDSIDGYTANTGGFVFGGDTLVGNGDFRVGGAVAYASTGIDGDGATSANRTDIDSYQGSLYGSWNAGAWYVDAALGYGRHQYDTKRYVALAGASVTGSHDANQYLAKIGAGYPMQMGKVTITPMATMTYVNLDQDGYTEEDRSHSGAALTVADTQTNSFRSGLGAKISVPLSEGSMKTAVEARAMWNHEFADTNQDIAAVFAGGTSFTTAGVNQARDSANLGLGLNLSTANRQNLSVNYDAEVKSDYVGHTASFKFRYDF